MKIKKFKNLTFVLVLLSFVIIPYKRIDSSLSEPIVADHSITKPIVADHSITNMVRFDLIPDEEISNAKNSLHIAYEHTSHGSQIVDGMTYLPQFKENNGGAIGLYSFNSSFLLDNAMESYAPDPSQARDLGYPQWSNATRNFLKAPENQDFNVVMWSWCGQVSSLTEQQMIDHYLTPMTELEEEFPNVMFVYMTGHVDGTGLTGNLHLRNEQIREFCKNNNKILFDFADIESYDPDGNYYGDKNVNDNCDWNNGTHSGNWAIDWQNNHTEGVEWYTCPCAHSQALNGNMKAYAVWWLWVRLAGWAPVVSESIEMLSFIVLSLISLAVLGLKKKF
ncbi:MAG: hypothetical protein ACTSP3_11325 [Candidatus Heimdallarchaeaceae archaeon]